MCNRYETYQTGFYFEDLGSLGVGSNGRNSTFSEHGLAAYQIKGNEECSNIQPHILSLYTSDPWDGVKHFFLKLSCCI